MSRSKFLARAAWYSGQAARNFNGERVVPEKWAEYADEWLAGYDGKKLQTI